MEKTVAAIEAIILALLMVLTYVGALLILPAVVLALAWGLGFDMVGALFVAGCVAVAVYAGYQAHKGS